ncbi:hypothetical protein DL764_008900 [Monosporascus ibericus]|uniref:Uncharacterized protein n=1 Tax=Monosporascus ibericus TaxID=155417 RepID=A0A4Q4SZ41_9PEZI|nr:hypothetical protein DL764_008900 [Monosporascus ibericus]
MRVADPVTGLVLPPGAAPKSKSKQTPKLGHGKRKMTEDEGKASPLTIDKVSVVNGITEMIITNWREVVRHLRSLDVLKASRHGQQYGPATKGRTLRPSASESFVVERYLAWNSDGPSTRETGRRVSAGASSEPLSPANGPAKARSFSEDSVRPPPGQQRQPRAQSPASSLKLLNRDLTHPLSPTVEESPLPRTPAAGSISEAAQTLVLLEVTAAGVALPPHRRDIRTLLRMPNVHRPRGDDNLRTREKVDAATVQDKKNTEAEKSERRFPPLKSLLWRWNVSYTHISEANADHASEHFDERDIPAEPTADVTELESGNVYLDTVEHLPEAQVHSLMQQLEACNEEVAELQRQLETLATFEKNSLYEQLQQARLEARAWHKTAEAAERRALVLERFMAQCRGLQEAAFEGAANPIARDDGDMQTRGDPSGAAQASWPGHVCRGSNGTDDQEVAAEGHW